MHVVDVVPSHEVGYPSFELVSGSLRAVGEPTTPDNRTVFEFDRPVLPSGIPVLLSSRIPGLLFIWRPVLPLAFLAIAICSLHLKINHVWIDMMN